MLLFHTVRRIYQLMGILPLKANYRRCSLNLQFFLISISIILLPISNVAFFLFAAQSRIEYVQSFCTSITQLACTINHLITFFEIANIQQLIKELGQFIQRSKFHDLFFV